jgi:hypothetical protein
MQGRKGFFSIWAVFDIFGSIRLDKSFSGKLETLKVLAFCNNTRGFSQP